MGCGIWAKVISELEAKEGLSMFSRNAAEYEAVLFSAEGEFHYYGSGNRESGWQEIEIDHYYGHRA